MTEPIASAGTEPIEQVREDMKVVDQSGAEIGRVDLVKLGDPQAVTTDGQETESDGGLVGAVHQAVGRSEPDVPEPLATRLVRQGFVKVDGKGLLERDFYLAADQIARVEGDRVHLSVGQDALITESGTAR
jgi:hypothetical protein